MVNSIPSILSGSRGASSERILSWCTWKMEVCQDKPVGTERRVPTDLRLQREGRGTEGWGPVVLPSASKLLVPP